MLFNLMQQLILFSDKTHTLITAHVALRFNAGQFPDTKRVFRIGSRKVKIPHNATVNLQTGAITYAGTFNGSFKGTKRMDAI